MTSSRRVRPRWVFGPSGFSSASCRSSRCGWLSPWPWGLCSEVLPSSSRSVARQPFDRHNPTAPARRPSSRRRTDESAPPRDRSARGVEKLHVSFHNPLALLLVDVERPHSALCDAAEDDAVRARHHVQSVSLRYERGLTRRGDRLDDGAVWGGGPCRFSERVSAIISPSCASESFSFSSWASFGSLWDCRECPTRRRPISSA